MLAASLAGSAGCEREQREFRANPRPLEVPSGPHAGPALSASHYTRNAHHVSQGKRLFHWYNCQGCHGNGGGGMGPSLIDGHWIYGGATEQIFSSIREGRAHGMPAFGGRVPDLQIWQLAAYVRSLGRHVRKDVAPGRGDALSPAPAKSEQARPREPAPEDRP